MNTCSTCRHWRKTSYTGMNQQIAAKQVGECRGGPPVADYKWPRSQACDSCARWEPIPGRPGRVATSTPHPEHQQEIFGAGQPAAGPAVLAYDAAPGSTPKAADPAPLHFATGTPADGPKTRRRKDS